MGGWRRLGIVFSVLWVIAAPFAVIGTWNMSQYHKFTECVHRGEASSDTNLSGWFSGCADTLNNQTVPVHAVLFGKYAGIWWGAVLGSLAALWALVEVTCWVAGWVREGFKRSRETPEFR